ncbi:hypothetical protein B6U93_02030 [Candidatus Woesearchaeota archaeon ex4484_78]|nr:MAG: hypothetical protein B6U93_02030 [Candidatus Woesearchaeota archaeon ex4484_78]
MKNKFNYNYFNLVYDIILEKEVVKPLYSFFQEILIRHYFLLFSYFYFENVALCILNKVHERPFFEEEFTRSDVLNTALNAVFWKNVEDASRDFKVHRFVDFLEKAQKQFNKKEDFNASDFLHTLLKELMKDVHKAFIDTLNYLSCNAKFNVDKKNLNLKNFARVYEFNLKR